MRVQESIVKLCDRWWSELAHSKTASMRTVAEEWLGYLGWMSEEPVFLEGAACGYVVSNTEGQRIAFYFSMPGELETPSSVLEKGLDYCETTLLLVGEAQLAKYDYTVITDLNRCYVYDTATDELILSSDSPRLFVEDVMETLQKEEVDQGSLDDARRDPASYTARQLRSWCERWTDALSREPHGSEGAAEAIMDRMLVLRFMYDHSVCEAPGWFYKGQFTNVVASSYEEAPTASKRNLVQLMDDMHRIWRCDLFVHDESVINVIVKSQCIVTMIQELALMANTKFSVLAILESFNYGDASEKARVRLVPEPNEEREIWLGKLGGGTPGDSKLEVDVLEEGYRAIPYWFDRLLESLNRIALEQDLSKQFSNCRVEPPVFGEMDLFEWEGDEAPSLAAQDTGTIDIVNVALRNHFYMWTSTQRQRRTARIVFLLHIIQSYESGRYPFGVFPESEMAFGDRPVMLEADRQWMYQGGANNSGEWGIA